MRGSVNGGMPEGIHSTAVLICEFYKSQIISSSYISLFSLWHTDDAIQIYARKRNRKRCFWKSKNDLLRLPEVILSSPEYIFGHLGAFSVFSEKAKITKMF